MVRLGGKMRDPLRELPIKTAETGFYRGFSLDVTLVSKVVLLGLVVWAIAFPENASAVLGKINSALLASFST